MTLAKHGLDGLLAPATAAARLARLAEEGLADEVGLTFVLDRVEELVHESPKAADDLAAVVESAASPWPTLLARARYLHARVLAERGELDAALALIGQARTGWWDAGQRLSALRTDLGRMQVLDDLGRHREAAAAGMELLAALDTLPADEPELRSWLRAATWDNIGVATGLLGEHERAIAAFERSEEVYRSLGMPDEVARPMANRGLELLRLGRAREARAVLGAAAAAFDGAGDRLWSAKCLAYLAQAHQQLGELVQALRALESTRVVMDELGAQAEAARARLAIAGAYLEVGLPSEARVQAEVAAELTTAAGMRRDTAAARFTVALADLAEGRLDAAEEALTEAAAMFDQAGARGELAKVALAEAEVALAAGRRAEAERRAAGAADELAAGGWLVPLAEARLRQADAATDEVATARHLAAAAEVLEQVGSPHLWYRYRLRLARLHRRQGRVDAAEALLRRAVDDVERLGGALPGLTLRTAFRAENLAAHDELVELLVGRGSAADVADAHRVSDRAKAQTLVDLVSGTVGRPDARPDGPAGAHRDEVDHCRADLGAVYGTLLTVTDPATRAQLRTRAAELEQELTTARLRWEITQAPDDAAGPAPRPGRPTAVPRVSYHVCGADVVAFVGQGDRLTSTTMPGVLPAVEAELERLTAQWSRFAIGPAFARRHQAALLAAVREVLRSLHRLLLAPVLPLLDGSDDGSGGELVVVPHRRLHQVPFHALHDGVGHVVQRWAVTTAPSTVGAAPAPVGAGPAFVLAVPDAHAPLVEAEAKALAEVLPDAEVLVGPGATWDALRAALPGPSLVHIACHGLYRPGNPLFSALRLADRWVTSAEVLELDLRGSLVTLSACETGRHGGDAAEPVGLAWAFLAAGAAGAVVSQWVAHDEATAELMADLYRHLAAGRAPAHALREAQLATAERWPHPFYWAPFSYVASPHREGSSP